MVNENMASTPRATVTSFLLKIAVFEDRLHVQESMFAEEESVNCLMEDEHGLFEQMKILCEGIQRGEKHFSFEFYSELRGRWFMIKANYTETLVDIKYPVFELLVTDITYIKHPMIKELASKMENARLVEEIHSAIVKIKLDEGYSIEWRNEYFVKYIGSQKFLRDCVPQEDIRKLKSLLEWDINCNTYSKKIRLLTSTGEIRWFDVRMERLNEQQLTDNSMYCIFSDVTDEVIREQQLKTFQKRYKMVLSITSELLFEYDVQKDTMYYFARGENTLHRPRKIEQFSKCIYEHGFDGGKLSPESESLIRNIQEKIKQNKDTREEIYLSYVQPNGEKQWLYVVGKCLRNEAGNIELVIGKLSDATDYKRAEERLLQKARTDALTKIDNREYAKEEITHYLLTQAAGYIPSMLILDVDNFKSINDSYGHGEGDSVLINVASILTREFRSTDVIGRLGGDEFIVFMKDVKCPSIVYKKAQTILTNIKETLEHVSVSIGISMLTEKEATFDNLYKTADYALYQAKLNGKNTYMSYNELSDEVKEEILESSTRMQYGMKTEREPLSYDPFAFLRQVLDSYDYVCRVNLTQDILCRYSMQSEVYHKQKQVSYSAVYNHLKKGMVTAEEQEEFTAYFSRENLLASFKKGEKRARCYVRSLDKWKKIQWYLVEVINHTEAKEEDAYCSLLVKEVEEQELFKFERKTSSQEDMDCLKQRHYDELTGIYSEPKFYFEVKKQLSDAAYKRYAIIAFDVDRFGVFNDIYNETVANKILCHIAGVLRKLEVNDKIYSRYCADRFTLFMSYRERADILNVIEKIRTQCMEVPFMKAQVKLSFGVYQIADISIPVRLMCDWARLAENTVKGLTMQHYAFYNEEYRNQIVERQLIENEMAGALREGQFKMYLQPKYNLETNTIIGAEALVRWKHPVKGMVRPDKFIPLFEKNGFIIQLDEYIWEEACKKISEWRKLGKDIPISVNISRIHTYDTNFVEKLVKLIEKYEIPVELLQLEFTESMFMDHEQALVSLMHRLKEQGFTLLMDDFGSGYSSLNMLKNVPIDIIKLDRIFFQDIMVNTRGKVIIESSIRMIHDLNLEVTAEGIEKEEHIEFLNKCNCNTGQGYFYSKPMCVEDFELLCLK